MMLDIQWLNVNDKNKFFENDKNSIENNNINIINTSESNLKKLDYKKFLDTSSFDHLPKCIKPKKAKANQRRYRKSKKRLILGQLHAFPKRIILQRYTFFG